MYKEAAEDFTRQLNLAGESFIPLRYRGMCYYELMQYEEALEDLNKALKHNNQDESCCFYLGKCYYSLGKYEKALEAFNLSIMYCDSCDKNSIFYYKRGLVYDELGAHDKAVADYTKAIELDEEDIDYYLRRGFAYARIKRYTEAIEDFTQGMDIIRKSILSGLKGYERYIPEIDNAFTAYIKNEYTDDPEIDKNILLALRKNFGYILKKLFTARGKSYYASGMCEHAIRDYMAAIKFADKKAEAYYERGCLYEKLQDDEKAIEDYSMAIILDYYNRQALDDYYRYKALKRRARLYEKQHEYEKALEDDAQVIKLYNKDERNYLNRARVYVKLKNYEKAAEDYIHAMVISNQALNQFSDKKDDFILQGTLNGTNQDYEGALTIENIISKLSSESEVLMQDDEDQDAHLLNYKGVLYYKDKEYKNAITEINKAIRLNPDFTEAYFNRGLIFASCSQRKRALKDLTQSIKLLSQKYETVTRENKIVNFNKELIEIYIKEYYHKLLAEAFCHRGINYEASGMMDKVTEDYNKAIELDDQCIMAYYQRACIYKNQGDYQKAIEDYNKVVLSNYEDKEDYYYQSLKDIAFCYEKTGQDEQAIACYTKAIGLKREDAENYLNRAEIYFKHEKYRQAIQDYHDAIIRDIKCAKAFTGRGNAYKELGNLEAANRDYKSAERLMACEKKLSKNVNH